MEEESAIADARELLARFRLAAMESEHADNLSGGSTAAAGSGPARCGTPKLLPLDEPTAGVHPKMVGEFREQLRSLRDDGLPMLMIEHELGIVEEVCQRVVAIARGRALAEGGPAEVRALPGVTSCSGR